MNELQVKLDKFKKYEPYLYFDQFSKDYWKSLELKYISPSLHVLSNYNAYKQLCKSKFKEYDSDKCAYSVSLLHSH